MSFKSKCLLGATLGLLAITAQARDVRFVAGMGMTFGGDKLQKIEYTNGKSQTIKAGEGVLMYGGLQLRPAEQPLSLRATLGVHLTGAFATNGSASFTRYPVELMGFYHINDNFKIGGGARRVINSNYDYDLAGRKYNVKFADTTGSVVEAAYVFARNGSVSLRYVKETYKLENGWNSGKLDGSHIGFAGDYAF